jgi:hypothetical protein
MKNELRTSGEDLTAPACGGASVQLKPDVQLLTAPGQKRRLVESFAIQALGITRRKKCEACQEGKGIYVQCRTLDGVLGRTCGNCKQRERGAQCNFSEQYRDEMKIARQNEKEEDLRELVTMKTSRGRSIEAPVYYSK